LIIITRALKFYTSTCAIGAYRKNNILKFRSKVVFCLPYFSANPSVIRTLYYITYDILPNITKDLCHHMQFLFLIGRFLKNLLLWNLVGSIYMYGRFCIKFP
jgi:hypothetical protein